MMCPKCEGPMRVIAFIEDERVARKILEHLGLPTGVPTVTPARAPPQASFDWDDGDGANPGPDYQRDDPAPDEMT